MAHPDYVQIGSIVVVQDEHGETETYVIVLPAEAVRTADSAPGARREGRVSSASPVGRALLGRRVGDEAVIPAPGGSFAVTIESVTPSL